jgi:hypothetical protein
MMARRQPWAMLPLSPETASKTYSDQMPLGSVPLNSERLPA